MEPLPPITEDFKKFIRGLLELGGLKKEHLDAFTNKKSLRYFREAFTHPSYNSDFNYEKFEFLGDLAINLCVGQYINDRYPDIKNVNWMTKMKLTLISKKTLGKIAKLHDFEKFIVYGEQAREELETERDSSLYNDLMEDTVEAFLGSLQKVVEVHGKAYGVYIALAKNIVYKFLDKLNIDAYDYTLYFDPISQLKEIYDAHQWDFKASIHHDQNESTGEHTITISTYPLGNKFPKRDNRVNYRARGYDKQETKALAAKKALKGLEAYNIRPKVPDPRARNIWKPKRKHTDS